MGITRGLTARSRLAVLATCYSEGVYTLLGKGDHRGAVEIFKLNVELFPKSSNAHDSLADGYMTAGKKELAIHYYEKALVLDLQNKNAEKKLKELSGAEQE